MKNVIQKIKCKFGYHVYDFKKNPMQSTPILFSGEPAYLFTYKCSCCGKVRRDITFRCSGGLDDIGDSDENITPMDEHEWVDAIMKIEEV